MILQIIPLEKIPLPIIIIGNEVLGIWDEYRENNTRELHYVIFARIGESIGKIIDAND